MENDKTLGIHDYIRTLDPNKKHYLAWDANEKQAISCISISGRLVDRKGVHDIALVRFIQECVNYGNLDSLKVKVIDVGREYNECSYIDISPLIEGEEWKNA